MFDSLKAGLDLASSALGIIRQAREALPDSAEKIRAGNEINAAERQLALAESQIADSLGYVLCQCTFPPQIMLYVKARGACVCPLCDAASSFRGSVHE